jgi:SAM-dependent methyltransferase
MMDSTVAQALVELNRRFYAEFGADFSATRQRIQPGVRKIISRLGGDERILDLGCGNGELARTLAQGGFHGEYLGLDFSLPLLRDAESQPGAFPVNFRTLDLTSPDWSMEAAHSLLIPGYWTLVTCFASLHHIPSRELRLNILRQVHQLLPPGGRFILSNWQFLNSEKLKSRIQPWETVGLSAADVDEGDYLLDWRAGGSGLRYAHHFSAEELGQLAAKTGFSVEESFLSDGENGRLGLYQTWRKG